MGARVILAVRSRQKGEAARREIVEATANPAVEALVADLSSQAQVRGLVRGLLERHPVLHVLINNAGVWRERRRESEEGIELTWATNVLASFLLTRLLLPPLRAAGEARIVNVSSRYAGQLDLTDLEFRRRPYRGRDAYAQSKQANRMLTWALARRLEGTGVTANAVHPGFVDTGLFRKAGGLTGWIAAAGAKLSALPPEQGADTVVWLAASPEVEGLSDRFWSERRERRCRFRDPEAEEALWERCEAMISGG
jgi:NAD(P)-dependent dehydrogenase (short-subunit alcohol dehydrogenase family)